MFINFIILIIMSIMPCKGGANIYKDQHYKVQQEKSIQSIPHIVFLINQDPHNYEAHKTIPPFAEMLKREFGFKVTVLQGEGRNGSYQFEDIDVLSKADLLVVFCRRIALPHKQMEIIRNYLKKG